MATQVIKDYDLSLGIKEIETVIPYNAQNTVITVEGSNIDSNDATVALKFTLDKKTYYPVYGCDNIPVSLTLVPDVSQNVEDYINHEFIPSALVKVIITPNSVTTGTLTIHFGGRTFKR